MRRTMIAILLLVVGLVVALWCRGGSPPVEDTIPAQEASERPNARHAGTEDRGANDQPSTTRPAPPTLPANGDARPVVVLDRGPRAPDEDPRRYEERMRFARRFDAFVRAARLNDAQVSALMLALYDDMVARSPLVGPAVDELQRGVKADQEWLDRNYGTTGYDWVTALQRILTPAQIRLWYRYCAGCNRQLWLREYEEPILELEGER